jgi:hypothetical protein
LIEGISTTIGSAFSRMNEPLATASSSSSDKDAAADTPPSTGTSAVTGMGSLISREIVDASFSSKGTAAELGGAEFASSASSASSCS